MQCSHTAGEAASANERDARRHPQDAAPARRHQL